MAAKGKGKGKAATGSLNVDFSNTDEGGSRLPAGEYIVKVTKAEVKDGENHPYINWSLEVVSGEFKGKKLYHNTTLAPHALFNLRNFLTALGVKVPKGKLSLKLKEYIGLVLGVYVEEGEYKKDGRKKKKTEVVEMFAVEKEGKKWVKVVDDEDEDEEDEDEDDDSDDDEDEEDEDEDEDSDDDEDDSEDEDDDDSDDDSDDEDDDDEEDDDDSDGDDDDSDDEDDDSDDDEDDDIDAELDEIINKGKAAKGKAGKAAKEEAPKGKGGKGVKATKEEVNAKGKGGKKK